LHQPDPGAGETGPGPEGLPLEWLRSGGGGETADRWRGKDLFEKLVSLIARRAPPPPRAESGNRQTADPATRSGFGGITVAAALSPDDELAAADWLEAEHFLGRFCRS
jgi:hypothetical protein